MLAGSGSTDWSLTLLRTRPLLARRRAAGYYWGVGFMRAGDPELIDFDIADLGADGHRRRKLASAAEVRAERAARRARRVLRLAARGDRRNGDPGDARCVAADGAAWADRVRLRRGLERQHVARHRAFRSPRRGSGRRAAAAFRAVGRSARAPVRPATPGAPSASVGAEPAPPANTAVRAAELDPGPIKTAAEYLAEPELATADAARGELLGFACAACHQFREEETLIGPHLRGVFGRRAASIEGFQYSPALRQSGLVWTPRSLEAWLADPAGFVEGTTMAFTGYRSAEDRRDLIAYLLRATQ